MCVIKKKRQRLCEVIGTPAIFEQARVIKQSKEFQNESKDTHTTYRFELNL